MNMAKFSEKLAELIELAKKKKNVLEYQEINDFFQGFSLDPEHMDKVLIIWKLTAWMCCVSRIMI